MDDIRPNRSLLVAAGAIDHHVGDMTATLACDLTLAQAQEKLAAAGHWLPVDGDASLTLRTLVETNSTGPLRLGYGAWRDLLLGAQFHNGRGELITAGGRTVKNVAGYDLTKFMVGQHGVFGELLNITCRTYRKPESGLLATFAPQAVKVSSVLATPLRPQWMLRTTDQLLFGYLGDERAISYCQANVTKLSPAELRPRTLDEDIALRQKLWRNSAFRASIAPSKLDEFVAGARLAGWVADPAFGIVLGSGEEPLVRSAAESRGGTVVFGSGDAFDYTPRTEGEKQLLARLKAAFDPEGKLAPLPWMR